MIAEESAMPKALDVVAEVQGDLVFVELDVRHNALVRVGDQYVARWADGTLTILRVESFRSAGEYSPFVAGASTRCAKGWSGRPPRWRRGRRTSARSRSCGSRASCSRTDRAGWA